ncbi:hypothetical protein AVEN_210438-1 [Araneus ventricosus]|uniref:Uncharacterized protein n=1 Tax=Araneus ventricosus TaxID=182803 RepID=A0A4Y2HUR1_ARAVE|nr:hypothetical protein AVEN_210438-1 [Araneus ventricosus]
MRIGRIFLDWHLSLTGSPLPTPRSLVSVEAGLRHTCVQVEGGGLRPMLASSSCRLTELQKNSGFTIKCDKENLVQERDARENELFLTEKMARDHFIHSLNSSHKMHIPMRKGVALQIPNS